MQKDELTPPLMPYEDWRKLGPEKAARYSATRHNWDAATEGKLAAILRACWHENEPTPTPTEHED